MSPFEPTYSKWGLIWLLEVTGGLTTTELAEALGAPMLTTWDRCQRLYEEDRVDFMIYGQGQREEIVWYAVRDE